MKQVVLFTRQVTLDQFIFQAVPSYTFIMLRRRSTRWLCYQGKYLITLSYFATMFTDQGYAQFIDDENAKVA